MALLEGNEEVRDLYQRLVLGGVITAEEFWQSREVVFPSFPFEIKMGANLTSVLVSPK